MKENENDEWLAQGEPFGYAINLDPVPTRTFFWGLKRDWAYNYCVLVLVRYLGSAMWVRYRRDQIRMA